MPRGTARVTYEILDDGFKYPKFTVGWGRKDFAECTVAAYGDVYLTAKGKAHGKRWRTQATLAEALHRHYGKTANRIYRRAIADIESN